MKLGTESVRWTRCCPRTTMSPRRTAGTVKCELSLRRGRRVHLQCTVRPMAVPPPIKLVLGPTEPPPVCPLPPPAWAAGVLCTGGLDPLACWLALEAALISVVAVSLWLRLSQPAEAAALPPPPPALWASVLSPLRRRSPPSVPPPVEAAAAAASLARALGSAYACLAAFCWHAALRGTAASRRAAGAALMLWSTLALLEEPTFSVGSHFVTTSRTRVHMALLVGTAISVWRARGPART